MSSWNFSLPSRVRYARGDDPTGRERILSGKRTEEKNADYFRDRCCIGARRGWLDESVLARETCSRQVLFLPAEAGLRYGVWRLLSRSGLEATSAESRTISIE